MKIFSFIIMFFGLLTMSEWTFPSNEEQAASNKIAILYSKNFQTFQGEVTKLARIANQSTSEEDIPKLKDQITAARYAYKKVEFLFDYLQTSYSHLFINGGPLPKLTEESDDIIEPNGLQTLDELIFSDESFNQMKHIKKLANDLNKSVDDVSDSHLYEKFSNHRIMEALRSGIVRVFTLGLTGFDTPGSGNALPGSHH